MNQTQASTDLPEAAAPDKLDKTPFGRKSGTEPGWLPEDELTREWLKYVEEYRSACDAADREESPNKGVTEEFTP